MRKTIAVISATGALLFGGAGVANATTESIASQSPTTTTLADNNNGQNTDQRSDNTGLWGLLGLLGLGGLMGLKRRGDTDTVTAVGTPTARGNV
ncbi:WGxxGxxG family protein [Mycobacterium sp. 1245805.9]|uniref:WGxxGxxG family protein n=1 Tax=Mycobacterium sp. 1245805.9 TaxID=1856862 RepID=UPI0008009C48|nr:WGxxGxxG family protein [Mycobacterium sp. 1245805.9]OBI87499.1 hypothetical protein A9X00_24245 [Mycobacterium sp. 1245805.9]